MTISRLTLSGSKEIASAVVSANLGSVYGATKFGTGSMSMRKVAAHLVRKSIIPAIMAGVLGNVIYGLIAAVIASVATAA